MTFSNNLKKQVDIPVWEWCRLAPAVSSAISATCTADNSLYHVTFGRYIYYMQAAPVGAGGTGAGGTGLTGFFRYDTVTDSYQLLSQPAIAATIMTAMQFAGGQGYNGRVLSAGPNTIVAAALTGQTLKSFDIRILSGTGAGQQRIITGVSDPIIADNGTATSAAAAPQNYFIDSNKNWIINQWVGYQVRFVSSAGQSQVRKIIYNTSTTIYFADVAKFAEEQQSWNPVIISGGFALVAAGSLYQIESSTIIVDSNWAVQPDATSKFVVRSGGIWMVSSGANYTIQYYDVAADSWYVRNAGTASSPMASLPAAGCDVSIVNTGENATVWERGVALGTHSTTTLQDTTKSWTTNQWVGYYLRIFSGTGENQLRVISANTSNTLTWVSAGTAPDGTSRYFIEAFEAGTITSTSSVTTLTAASGSSGSPNITTTTNSPANCNGWAISGLGIGVGAVISSGQGTSSLVLSVNNTAAVSGPLVISPIGTSTGSITGSVFTAGATTGAYYPGQILSGTNVQTTNTLNSQALACFCPAASATVVLSAGNTTGITAGMLVTVTSTGTGSLTAGTYVSSVTNSTTLVLNQNVATALTGASLQFTTAFVTAPSAATSNGVKVTLSSGTTTGLIPGMFITIAGGTGAVPVGTYVISVDSGTTFTLSQQPTTAFSGANVLTCQPYQTVIVNQLSGVVGGAGKYTVFPSQTVSSTTITGMGVSTVTDTSKNWSINRWNNYAIRIKSGTGAGQVRNIIDTLPGSVVYTSASGATNSGATITVSDTTGLLAGMVLNVSSGTGAFTFGTTVVSVTNGTTFIASSAPTTALSASAVVTGSPVNTLKIYPAWTTIPDSTSIYTIHGDSDKIFMSFSVPAAPAQASTFVHNIDSDTVTTGRLLDSGAARGISAQYADHTPVAIASGVPVLPITGAVGYITGVGTATTAASVAANIATVTHAGGIFAIGSWVTIAGVTNTSYNGTWQVINSSIGSVSFWSTTATGTQTVAGTIGQSNSFTLGGNLASGAYASLGTSTTLTVSGCLPATYNGSITVTAGPGGTLGSGGGYQSTASGSGSGTTITVADTTNLRAGMIPTVTSGTGQFATGTVVTSITNGTTFVINLSPTVALSSAVITVVPTIPFPAGTVAGNLTTLGVVNKTPQAITSGSRSGSATATIVMSLTIFPVGSWITVSGCTPGSYNGVYQVTASSAGSVSYVSPLSTTDTITTVGTIGLATSTELVTTVNPYVFQTGQTVVHRGDTGFSAVNTNISAAITPVMNAAGSASVSTQYTYPVASPSGPMVLYGQSTTQLCDASKNWVPNQWAGAIVTFNTNQITAVAAPVQPNIYSAYILANTATTLIFAAAQTTAPANGITRYVITTPSTFAVGSAIGSADSGLALGLEASGSLQDLTKSWATPALISAITATSITIGAAVATVSSVSGLYPGMIVAITAGGTTLPSGTTISSISGLVVTMSNNFGGSGTTATFTFAAVCSSAGTTITVSGYNTLGLSVGMYVAVTSVANLSPSVPTAGAFVANGGTNLTTVQVTSIISTTQFTVSSAPLIPLVNASVLAAFWFPNQWVNRRVRLTCGAATGTNYLEATVTSNTVNTLTVAINLPVHGVTGYTILQQTPRGVGTNLSWNFGQTSVSRRGVYLLQARGGNLVGFDRLNLTTDKWEFLSATPNFETLTTGAMYAYDGGDRLYFTSQITQRVYYLDLEQMQIHGGSLYPYVPGTAIVGNRMEIFETADGLKYLWLNRHSGQECFKQLLFY